MLPLLLWLVGCGETPASGTGAPSEAPRPTDVVVASWNGGRITQAQLEAQLADELRQLEIQYRLDRYERLHRALDAMVEDALLDGEVARRNLPDREALFREEVDGKLVEPTEAELLAEFEDFRREVPNAEYAAARPFLRRQLLNVRRQQRQEQFLRELEASAGLRIELPFPEIPRADIPIDPTDPVRGNPDAPLTIVEFGGYQCYYCRRVKPVIERLLREYDGQIRVVFKDFPLAGHARARAAAVAAHCAGEQDRFWELSSVLLDNQGHLEDADLERFARDLGLDMERWTRCLTRPEWQRRIDDDVRLGRELGVTSTPTFFVNGLMVQGAHPYDRFAALVEQELKAAAP